MHTSGQTYNQPCVVVVLNPHIGLRLGRKMALAGLELTVAACIVERVVGIV